MAQCSASESEDSGGAAGAGGASADGSACFGPSCGGGGGFGGSTGGAAGAPPEQELESSFRSPVVTGKYVWAANPESGRVALIDALTLDVRTVEAGNGPTFLAPIVKPGDTSSRAIVLNVRSHDATILVAAPDGTISTSTVLVHEDANSWAISSKASFAIAWTDAAAVKQPDPTQGFQDVTVISLEPGKETSTRLSVGYRPTRIFIAADESRAFVVTEPGVSVIELGGPGGPLVSMDVPVTDDPLENPASRDVSITPDGKFALVRRDGSAEVGVVSLADAQRVVVQLSGPVTDLDLSDDGTRAVAVVRQPFGPVDADAGADSAVEDGAAGSDGATDSDGAVEAGAGGAAGAAGAGGVAGAGTDAGVEAGPPPASEVAVLPVPGIFGAPTVFDTVELTGESVGSVALSADGSVALLFTNATPNDHLTMLKTKPGADYLKLRTVALKAAVQAVFPTPDGAHAVALLSPAAGSTKPGAFSLVPVAAELPPKILGTDAPPVGVAIQAAPSTRALVTVRDDVKKIWATHLVRMPQLQIDSFPLASPPLATGIADQAGMGYVAQEHPEGRITFIDLAKIKARTLTGFELGAKVVDGSK